MRSIALALGALSLALFVSVAVPDSPAAAKTYRGKARATHYKTCRHSSGTTGLVAGGVGGALIGESIVGHGLLGTAAGAAGGALAGRAIDRTITAKRRGCN